MSLRFTSLAFAEIGANSPNAAGATSKLLKSFIKIPHTEIYNVIYYNYFF